MANKVQAADRLKEWLYDNGFEGGFTDKALHKPLAMIMLCAVGGLFWFQVSADSISSLKAQLAEEKDREKIVRDYEETLAMRNSLITDTAVPSDKDAREWAQTQVNALAAESHLEVVSSELTEEKVLSPELSLVQFKFVFRGGYRALGTFLSHVETSSPAIGVESLEFARGREFEPESGVQMEIKAALFVLGRKKSEAAKP